MTDRNKGKLDFDIETGEKEEKKKEKNIITQNSKRKTREAN